MFWPAMFAFILLAITPFIVATALNRYHGDSLSDSDELHSADSGAIDSSSEGEA